MKIIDEGIFVQIINDHCNKRLIERCLFTEFSELKKVTIKGRWLLFKNLEKLICCHNGKGYTHSIRIK